MSPSLAIELTAPSAPSSKPAPSASGEGKAFDRELRDATTRPSTASATPTSSRPELKSDAATANAPPKNTEAKASGTQLADSAKTPDAAAQAATVARAPIIVPLPVIEPVASESSEVPEAELDEQSADSPLAAIALATYVTPPLVDENNLPIESSIIEGELGETELGTDVGQPASTAGQVVATAVGQSSVDDKATNVAPPEAVNTPALPASVVLPREQKKPPEADVGLPQASAIASEDQPVKQVVVTVNEEPSVQQSVSNKRSSGKSAGERVDSIGDSLEPSLPTAAQVNALAPMALTTDGKPQEKRQGVQEPTESFAVDTPGQQAVASAEKPEPSNPAVNTGGATPAPSQVEKADRTEPPVHVQQHEVDRARFIQRVTRAFQAANDEGGQIRLRLKPPELGAVKIELAIQDGVLSAQLETETSAARSLLVDNLPALKERLAEMNIKIEKFDVDVHNDSGKQTFEQTADRENPQQSQRGRYPQSQNNHAQSITVRQPTSKAGETTALNVII